MNSSRWRALVDCHDVDLSVRAYRCRCLDGDPQDDELWAPWPEFMPYWNTIEWLDFRMREDKTINITQAASVAQLTPALRSLSIRFTTEGPYIRIWGYTRPGATPQFE